MASRSGTHEEDAGWEEQLGELLPLLGHRNWIVVADAAYPAQSKEGIETVVLECGQMEAVKTVRAAIAAQKHICAQVYVDAELAHVAEKDARGVGLYRRRLSALLGAAVKTLPHEEIIAKLDKAAKKFRVVILKTTMTIPYTSVFFELECGYWNAQAEEALRARMTAAKKKK